MSKSTSIFLAGLLVGALLMSGAFALILRNKPAATASAEKRVLKLAHGLPPNHPVHIAMEHMKEHLEKISSGAMTIEIYPSGVLGGETECIEQLQNGALAMTKTSSAPMEAFIPEMQLFGLPYVFRDEEHFWKILSGEIGAQLLEQGRDKGLLGLCYYDAGSRNFYTAKRQIKTPADLKGLKIRVQNSPVAIKMVKALGGAPTPISWGELYSALAQGIVDGAENNMPSFISNKHWEVCKFFSLDAHTRVPDILLISTPIWEKLSSGEQEWLQEAANVSSTYQRDLWKKKTIEDIKEARRLGVEIYDPDKKPFMDLVAPLYDEYEGTSVGALLERIRAVK